jgi:hypothetical protein
MPAALLTGPRDHRTAGSCDAALCHSSYASRVVVIFIFVVLIVFVVFRD